MVRPEECAQGGQDTPCCTSICSLQRLWQRAVAASTPAVPSEAGLGSSILLQFLRSGLSSHGPSTPAFPPGGTGPTGCCPGCGSAVEFVQRHSCGGSSTSELHRVTCESASVANERCGIPVGGHGVRTGGAYHRLRRTRFQASIRTPIAPECHVLLHPVGRLPLTIFKA